MLFRRGSSVHSEAQKQAIFAELLTERHFMKVQARPKTIEERIENWCESLRKLTVLRFFDPVLKMADGIFYNDLREPFQTLDVPSVTLAGTNKALYTAGNFPTLGGNYFARIGKALRVRIFGRITSAATPGNLTLAAFLGSGADANGTSVVASAAQAMTANQSNLSFMAEVDVHCRTIGATGTLFGTGFAIFNEAIIAPKLMLPASSPAATGSVDLTAAAIISMQALRSGSTAEAIQLHNVQAIALN